MSNIIVPSHTGENFHGGMLPNAGEPAITVVGLDEAGLSFIDEELVYRLASDELGPAPVRGSYEEPELPISAMLRGQKYDKRGDIRFRVKSQEPLGAAALSGGEARIERVGNKVHVDWQAELCFKGVGVVAESRATTQHYIRRPRNSPIIVERKLVPGTGEIETNDAFISWARRNSIDMRPHRKRK